MNFVTLRDDKFGSQLHCLSPLLGRARFQTEALPRHWRTEVNLQAGRQRVLGRVDRNPCLLPCMTHQKIAGEQFYTDASWPILLGPVAASGPGRLP
jgi:hypothetical protein